MTADVPPKPVAAGDLQFRSPRLEDGAAVWRLSRASGALDENSPYAYLLVCSHFAATSAVAEADGRVVAFASCYRPPTHPEAVFVWQVAVDAALRGRGVGRALLGAVLDRPANHDATHLEATVTVSNDPSQRLFRSFATRRAAACEVSVLFPAEVFPGQEHETELLFRIGPLRSPAQTAPPGNRPALTPTRYAPS